MGARTKQIYTLKQDPKITIEKYDGSDTYMVHDRREGGNNWMPYGSLRGAKGFVAKKMNLEYDEATFDMVVEEVK